MTSYTLNEVKSYARKFISKVLPLDPESVAQIVDYAISSLHTREAVSRHFMDLLGETSEVLDFITKFSDMLFGNDTKKTVKVVNKKSNPLSGDIAWSKNNASNHKNTQKSARLAHNTSRGVNTSELIDQIPSHEQLRKKHAKKTLNSLKDLDSALNELDVSDKSGLKESKEVVRICNCNATRHPLFTMFPNCLNCGKIICVKEGFQPCSYCGKPLLTNAERLELVGILQQEKDELLGKKTSERSNSQNHQNKKKKKKKVIKISINSAGTNNYRIQERAFKRIERKRELEMKKEEAIKEKEELNKQIKAEEEKTKQVKMKSKDNVKDEELVKAEARLDKLLDFQANGAERTNIIDEASDYDLPTASYNLWASPLERALQLKRQQKQMRIQREDEERRSGRGKKVVNISIRNGKAYLHEVKGSESSDRDNSEDRDIKDLTSQLRKEKTDELEEKSQHVWDYESDQRKWSRPVYVGKLDKKKDEKEKESIASKHAVQLGDDEAQEDAIFSMIGV